MDPLRKQALEKLENNKVLRKAERREIGWYIAEKDRKIEALQEKVKELETHNENLLERNGILESDLEKSLALNRKQDAELDALTQQFVSGETEFLKLLTDAHGGFVRIRPSDIRTIQPSEKTNGTGSVINGSIEVVHGASEIEQLIEHASSPISGRESERYGESLSQSQSRR